MNSDQPNTGPSEESLRRLRGMLPSMAKGLAQRRIGGKGVPVRKRQFPTKQCRACKSYSEPVEATTPQPITAIICEDCEKRFMDGEQLCVRGDTRLWIRSGWLLATFPGKKIIHVDELTMRKLIAKLPSSPPAPAPPPNNGSPPV